MKLFKRQEDRSTQLVLGLGNHEAHYKNNRHNIGFMIVDHLAARREMAITKKQSRSLLVTMTFQDKKVILAKPRTYMNQSGRAAQAILSYYKLVPNRMMVIFDDLDLPLGVIRIRPSGGTGGHRGMRSIQNTLKTQDYPRMRVGIGRPPGRMDPAAYVLQDFSKDELEIVEQCIERAVDCLIVFLEQGIEDAMNSCNQAVQAT